MNETWIPYPDVEYMELAQVQVCYAKGSFGMAHQCLYCDNIRKVNGCVFCLHYGLPRDCFELSYVCKQYIPIP